MSRTEPALSPLASIEKLQFLFLEHIDLPIVPMASQAEPLSLHILFFPLMAPGHMLPMLDIAKFFSARDGVTSTFLTTPGNAPLVEPTLGHCKLHLIPFPSDSGLPQGCENLSAVFPQDLERNFFDAVKELHQPFLRVLKEVRPDCVITDGFFPWTYYAAAELSIARLVFHGTNLFSRCVFDSIGRFNIFANLAPGAESLVIPGLPHRIEVLLSQMPDKLEPFFLDLFAQMVETEAKSYGVLVNSFYELEPDYCRHYREVVGRRAWCVGPVSLCNQEAVDKLCRGVDCKASTTDDDNINWLKDWLNIKRPGSVVYLSFGSLCILSKDQLREVALALEACEHPFIWVIGKGDGYPELEGFKERMDGRGVIVRGWAPQLLILNHRSVGGFMTHCGWNSCLEGISSGLPLATWPMFAEQFYNERFIVDVLKIGVAVGAENYTVKQEERPVIEAEKIERAVRGLMGDGEEAEKRRKRAVELGKMAKKAVEKGGSSFQDMTGLIEELVNNSRPAKLH